METLQVVSLDSDGVWRVNTLTLSQVELGLVSGTVAEESIGFSGDFGQLISVANYHNLKGRGR